MGRQADKFPLDINREAITILLELNVQQAILVNKLLGIGFFGISPKQVCQRLLDESLLKYARDTQLPELQTPPDG